MNKKLFFTVLLACSLNFLGFSQNVQDELLNYINKGLPKVGELEQKALDSYASVTGTNYKDDNTTYNTMVNTVIPTYSSMIKKLKALSTSLKTTEVQTFNELYLVAAKIQLSGFNIFVEGLEKGDISIVQLANKKLERARKLMDEWSNEMDELCNYYGVTSQ